MSTLFRQLQMLNANDRTLMNLLDQSCGNAFRLNEFRQWMSTVGHQILPHSASIFGKGTVSANRFHVDLAVPSGLPATYLRETASDPTNPSPVFSQWMKSNAPVFYDGTRHLEQPANSSWEQTFHRHNLRNVVLHGVIDVTRENFSFFAFYGFDNREGNASRVRLNLLAHYVHDALLPRQEKIDTKSPLILDNLNRLSVAEEEVFHWLVAGKSNWEIAQILGKSKWTVKNQIKKIFDKLGISNRASAVRRFFESTSNDARHSISNPKTTRAETNIN